MTRTAIALLLLAACSSSEPTTSAGPSDPTPPASTSPTPSPSSPGEDAAAAPDASGDAGPAKGPPPSNLPVNYTRPDVGTPLTPQELSAATDQLIALLKETRYFDVVDERVHGWPANAPGFSYGTWWSGVNIVKAAGKVTYQHGADGADNNGLRTAPLLEGACYAHLMWGAPLTASLVQRMTRGYSSWALTMKRSATDPAATMLARAQYPASVTSTEGGRSIFIDTSLDRPGIDNDATDYVHLPTNPTFGDVFVKNKRSKDDMGHIFRSLALVEPCVPRLSGAAQADFAQAKMLYASWAQAVEDNGYGIATLDQSTNVYTPPLTETLAHYTLTGNVECPGALMIRLLGRGDPGTLSCGNGISTSESLLGSTLKSSVRQVLRTHHEAAVAWALRTGQNAVALSLLQGLATRVENDVASASQATPPDNVTPTDVVQLAIAAANTGVPLTSTEVRFVHAHLATAWASYRAPAMAATYHVFENATPDGSYAFEPSGGPNAMSFSDIGLLVGSCASPYRNATTRPLLDCAKLLAAFP